jgi:hypothetical protein
MWRRNGATCWSRRTALLVSFESSYKLQDVAYNREVVNEATLHRITDIFAE